MPIVNGTYVPDTLPGVKSGQWQQQAFGAVGSGADWSDSKTAAFNYLMKQQEQAYNLELWNLQNQYNSPIETMKRFQDAGLNPNLIYSQQNPASAPQAASAFNFRSSGNANKSMQNALGMINQVMSTVRAARETYDYMKYGRQASSLQNQVDEWRVRLLSSQETAQNLDNYWQQFLQGRLQLDPNAPGVRMYQNQMNVQEQRYEQLKALCNMIPDQQARYKALKQLDDERLSILKSQTGFITNFNTGNESFDSFFKMLAFFVMNSGT